MNADPAADPVQAIPLDSIYDIAVSGGPLMWPIALCSVIALTYVVERALHLRDRELGSADYGRTVIAALAAGGPAKAVAVCEAEPRPLGRILRSGLLRASSGPLEREKAVEDAGARELSRMNARLRPLAVVAVLAPLLGFLGTVFGMIQAFIDIAMKDGLGRPELLAAGISQALVTTAAGLCVAIPSQAAWFFFRGRVDRFARRSEDAYLELDEALAHASAAPVPPPQPSAVRATAAADEPAAEASAVPAASAEGVSSPGGAA